MTLHERLNAVADQLRNGEPAPVISVREFLGWANAQRRGYYVVKGIRSALEATGVVTSPDFEGAYIGSTITFGLKPAEGTGQVSGGGALTGNGHAPELSGVVGVEIQVPIAALLTGGVADPTYRIGKLDAANRLPLAVAPNTPLAEAVTLMLMHDYSQLPVMQGDRNVRGVVSWKSIGSRATTVALGVTAGECMDGVSEIGADQSLFAALPQIVGHEYVLIRGTDQKITGIVTTSDLSLQFQQLAEPFLLLGEIENHIRRLIDGKFTPDEVKAACDPDDADREVASVADLAFGEYIRLLENPDMWVKTGLQIHRATFVKRLDRVREIRNDVMHFDPDGIATEDYDTLRQFAAFLQHLQSIGVT